MNGTPLKFDVFTLFPAMFSGPLDESIIERARQRLLIEIAVHDIRDWTHDRHRTVDDNPFGGGAGMVMKAPPIVEAVEQTLGDMIGETEILLMSAGGRRFDQAFARSLAARTRIAIICGHYEGIDDRVRQILPCSEVSIGDFVLTGGELPAMTIIDAVSRLAPESFKRPRSKRSRTKPASSNIPTSRVPRSTGDSACPRCC